MLTELHIENIAVISRSEAEFTPGFNVLTGETGAGKSIVIDSIDAVLGGRTSRELVRTGQDRATVSAVFTETDVSGWFEENDLEWDGGELVLMRRISADGKNSCRVNGMPVSVAQLRSLGSLLLDIHGQNDGRQLMDESRHRAYLDGFGDVGAEAAAFRASYEAWRTASAEAERLRMDDIEKGRLTETLKDKIAELESAALRPGEEDELLGRRDMLKNSEKLTEAIEYAYGTLTEDDTSAISLASSAAAELDRAAQYSEELGRIASEVTEARYMLEDASERLHDIRESLDFSPDEYDALETRLALLRRLQRKYAADEAGLIQQLEDARTRLDELEFAGDRLVKLEKELTERLAETKKAASALTQKRISAAEELEKRIEAELSELNMPSVRFKVDIQPVPREPGFDASGADQIRFLMSANAGEEPGRISRIASGGELSRIMLAMKSVLAEQETVGTLIFDEIDTGVSGRAAQKVAEKIARIAKNKQVLCVTHLPQLAAMADTHFSVEKGEQNGQTYTRVVRLDREQRKAELARITGGVKVTEALLESAGELLDEAENYRKTV